MVSYHTSGEIPSQHPRCAKVMTNSPRLPKEEVLYQDEPTSRAGIRAMWTPEEKKVSWMGILVLKFSKADDLWKDMCACACSTAKGCVLLDQHREFVGCDVAHDVLSAVEPDFVQRVASRMLKPMLDISGSSEVEAVAEVSRDEMDAFFAKKKPLC